MSSELNHPEELVFNWLFRDRSVACRPAADQSVRLHGRDKTMAKRITGQLANQLNGLKDLLAERPPRLQLIASRAVKIANAMGSMERVRQRLTDEETKNLNLALTAVSGRGDRFDVEPPEGETRPRRRTRPAQARRR